MASERYETGLRIHKEDLGEEHVERALAGADDFNRDFQDLVTEYCWGTCWGEDTLDKRQRSLLNLGMIAALNRMHEWELHFKGAIANGLPRDELKSILTQITIYCGVPVGVECFRIARKVFAESAAS